MSRTRQLHSLSIRASSSASVQRVGNLLHCTISNKSPLIVNFFFTKKEIMLDWLLLVFPNYLFTYSSVTMPAISPVEHSKTSHLPNNGKNFPRVRCFSKIEETKDMYFHPSEKRRYYRRLKKKTAPSRFLTIVYAIITAC